MVSSFPAVISIFLVCASAVILFFLLFPLVIAGFSSVLLYGANFFCSTNPAAVAADGDMNSIKTTAVDGSLLVRSKLYVGRVWHTRFLPKRHAFSYPIFMFALDLEELQELSQRSNFNFNFLSKLLLLWPIVAFDESDHLKNGEGQQDKDDNSNSSNNKYHLAQRICRLVKQRTSEQFQPTTETHHIVLLTHLTYYGYNFNPVSFYYLVDKQSNQVSAMVGEVSNTPWLEMYPYVLHPNSQDKVQCRTRSLRYEYSFPKTFHVSPFMEMDYWYDWSFAGIPTTKDDDGTTLNIVNSLRRRNKEKIDTKNKKVLDFTAKMIVHQQPITPWSIAWQCVRFPIFCMLIQFWIHYQAFWLFMKGIVYVPHPDGSESTASRTIAAIMAPFFALRDRLKPSSKTIITTVPTSSSTTTNISGGSSGGKKKSV